MGHEPVVRCDGIQTWFSTRHAFRDEFLAYSASGAEGVSLEATTDVKPQAASTRRTVPTINSNGVLAISLRLDHVPYPNFRPIKTRRV
jgi:hypothetical protein